MARKIQNKAKKPKNTTTNPNFKREITITAEKSNKCLNLETNGRPVFLR